MRRNYELGKLWPGLFNFAGAAGEAFDRFPFTYIDGGAFNNEPIREAFRLASFLDSPPGNLDGTPRNADFNGALSSLIPMSMQSPIPTVFPSTTK